MAEKKKNAPSSAKESAYYQLHTSAVEDLVGAKPENTPHYSQAELEKYKSRRFKFRFPPALKALLIKYWFYGAVCFFVFMGLGIYVTALMDMYFIAAVIMGMVTDLLINHFLRFTENMPGGSKKWMMITKRGAWGMVMNIAYAFLLLYLIMAIYGLINSMLSSGGDQAVILPVEPLLFSLFATGLDTLMIGVKRGFLKVFEDAKKNIKS